jgi:CDP-diacylglycerol---glycerol-3-phosphate 3-phosphatidyltransferase
MPSVYDLKPRFQQMLRPAMRGLAQAGITPNMVTLTAVAGSFAAGWCAAYHSLWALPLWLFLRMALNAIDGMMARELNQMTRAGAILNELGDVVSDAAIYLPLAAKPPHEWPVAIFVVGALLTEFCGVLQQALTGVRRYEGPMGKSDRAFAIGLLAILTSLWPLAAMPYWPHVFWTLSALTALTCWNRLRART